MKLDLTGVDLDLERAGTWPVAVKIVVVAFLCAVIGGIGYYLDTRAQLEVLETERGREEELKRTFELKQKKAVNLDVYKKQLERIEQTFGDLLKQLPDKTQVPELLIDVSQTGLASGLEFELFKPGAEVNKEFYAELPIQIRVVGDYLKFGAFVSGLAALPRIVTVHNIKIMRRPDTNPKAKEQLTMEAIVKTYHYLDETTAKAPPKAPAKPAGQ
ncbi:MAG: type 4a pilus biogenesis protein PilO [Methylotetracoccus sp.]